MLKQPEKTDWLSPVEQQAWFDMFNSKDGSGIKFNQFQEFLKATIYTYFARIGPSSSNNNNKTAQQDIQEEKAELGFTYQQEMLLFKVFDLKNDHVIDRDEFTNLCQNWLDKTYRRSCALVIVDVQNDFIDGSLALLNGPANEDGVEVVPVINKILDSCNFDAIAYTQDWHPTDHIGFHDNLHLRKYTIKEGDQAITNRTEESSETTSTSTNGNSATGGGSCRFKLKKMISNAKMFDTVLFDEGKMEQKLWPIHCVQNSWGAELHPKLKIVPNAIRIYKGTLSHVDAYSAFWDNMRLNETGLRQELNSRKIQDIFFCGLALDYCVSASALDAARAGFATFVIEDACRGIDNTEMEKRKAEMIETGIILVNSKMINSYLTQVHANQSDGSKKYIQDLQQTNCSLKETLFNNNSKQASSTSSSCDISDRMLLVDICFKRALALRG